MGRIWQWREETAADLWAEAGALIRRGLLLALPTETYFALAVHPFQEAALHRLFTLKERPREKPVLVLVADQEMTLRVASAIPEAARRLMAKFWPGPLTLILPARPDLPDLLTGGTGTVGVRQPRQPVTCRLLAALGLPLTGTSANRSGRPPLTAAAQVSRELADGVSLILDAGPCPGGAPSTIVDVSRAPARLVRRGAVTPEQVAEVIPELLENTDQ